MHHATSIPLLIASMLCVVHSYQHYQQSIPNGDKVPHPQSSGMWQGVGHDNAQGRGERNPFGKDFSDNNHVWNKQLCQKDSDKDGLTNGEELGDPNCVWTKGTTPSKTSGLSHPGICEPVNSVACQGVNSGVDMDSGKPFDCPATSEPGVLTMSMRFPTTKIPAVETSYFCKYFPLDVPAGTSHHIIAYEPITDNTEVMHHTILYGCKGEEAEAMKDRTTPFDCKSGMDACTDFMLLWGVGLDGMCYPDKYGGLIGKGGYVGVVMEHHWNNPLEKSGMTDSSGMRLYHTPNLRQNSAAYVLWGPTRFSIPPQEDAVMRAAKCDEKRTSSFTSESITIVNIIPHMHYYGRAMTVKHSRPGVFDDKVILTQDAYNYDSPEIFDTSLEFMRGDEMVVECTFNTRTSDDTVYFGEATSDEMCFMIAMVYPFDNSVPVFCGKPLSFAPASMVASVTVLLSGILLNIICL